MFVCHFCKKQTNTWKAHLQHFLENHPDRSTVPYCGWHHCTRLVKSESYMQSHLLDIHRVSVKKGTSIIHKSIDTKCNVPLCSQESQDCNALFTHLNDHLRFGIPVKCPFPECSLMQTRPWYFHDHLMSRHIAVLDDLCQEDVPLKTSNDLPNVEEEQDSYYEFSEPVDLSKNAKAKLDQQRNNLELIQAMFLNFESSKTNNSLNAEFKVDGSMSLKYSRQLEILQQALLLKRLRRIRSERRSSDSIPLTLELYHTRILQYMRIMVLPWHRFPVSLLNACDCHERPSASDLETMTHIIADDLGNQMGEITLKTVINLADDICQKFPGTFADRVGNDVVQGDSLAARIYVALCNLKRSQKSFIDKKSKKRKADEAFSDQESRKAPICSSAIDYSISTRKSKTRRSSSDARHKEKKVCKRSEISAKKENEASVHTLSSLTENSECIRVWRSRGLLSEPKYFLTYASIFLQKDVCSAWITGMIRNRCIFDLISGTVGGEVGGGMEERRIRRELENCAAADSRQNVNARTIAIFPLMIHYFGENVNLFYRVINEEILEELNHSALTPNPQLIVKGNSIYDVNATCIIAIDGKEYMKGVNVLQGFLIVFLAYFIFGIEYPCELVKTLQVIQRIIMDINPSQEMYLSDEKPQYMALDPAARIFINKIQGFR